MSSDDSGYESFDVDGPELDDAAPFPVTSHLDQLAEELRTIAGLRSRNAIRDRTFPLLVELLPDDSRADPELRYAALQQLVEAGLEDMPGGDHRQAATALLAYGSGRWRPLTKRGSEAAAAFGLGWDAYRRRRESTGSSLVMETLTELASVLLGATEPSPATSPSTTSSAAAVAPVHLTPVAQPIPSVPASSSSTGEPGPPRTALLAAIVVMAVVAIAIGAFLSLRGNSAGEAAAEPVNCGNLTSVAGDHAEGASNQITRWAEAFASAAKDLRDGEAECAGVMSQRDGVVYQELSPGINGGVSALIVSDDGSGKVVTFDHLEFFRYRAEAWDPDVPAPGIGTPVRRADRNGGPRVVELTNGVLVQEAPEVPAIAVVGDLWKSWLDEGGFDGSLGIPVSNVYDLPGTGRVQEFTDGNLQVDYRSGAISVTYPDPVDLELPDDYTGAILVSRSTNTAWFVDDDGVRHWLPTGDDFRCVKLHHNAVVITDVSHVAISRLSAGEPSRCR